MPAERPSLDSRRSNKPVMEKRRRARINQCLNELKGLILDALRKDPTRHSKLEKADILEMTVRHLQNVQRQQMALAVTADPSVLSRYRAGFNECATEVSRYVARLEGVDQAIRTRLLSHLAACLTGISTMAPLALAGLGLGVGAAGVMSTMLSGVLPHLHSGAISASTLNTIPQVPFPMADLSKNNNSERVQLIPGRLPSGDIAFVLPGSNLIQKSKANVPMNPILPLFSPNPPSSTVTSEPLRTPSPIKQEIICLQTVPPASTCSSSSAFTAVPKNGPSQLSTAPQLNSPSRAGSNGFSSPLRESLQPPNLPIDSQQASVRPEDMILHNARAGRTMDMELQLGIGVEVRVGVKREPELLECGSIAVVAESPQHPVAPPSAENDRMWRPW